MAFCKDCGCTRLVQTESDLTCTDCGLEQGFGNITTDYEFFQQSHPMYTNATVRENVSAITKISFSDSIQTCIGFDEEEMRTASEMYILVIKDRKHGISIKGEQRHKELLTACCYILSRRRTMQDFVNMTSTTGVNQIAWACKLIHKVLINHYEYKCYFTQPRHTSVQSISLSNVILQETKYESYLQNMQTTFKWSPQENKIIRSTFFKLVNKVGSLSKSMSTLNIRPDKLVSSFLYMACIFSRVKVKLSVLAHCCGTSEATVIKGETYLKSVMST